MNDVRSVDKKYFQLSQVIYYYIHIYIYLFKVCIYGLAGTGMAFAAQQMGGTVLQVRCIP